MTAPGDLVGCVTPTYAMYQVYARLFQVELVEIGYSESLELKMDELERFLEWEKRRETVIPGHVIR